MLAAVCLSKFHYLTLTHPSNLKHHRDRHHHLRHASTRLKLPSKRKSSSTPEKWAKSVSPPPTLWHHCIITVMRQSVPQPSYRPTHADAFCRDTRSSAPSETERIRVRTQAVISMTAITSPFTLLTTTMSHLLTLSSLSEI